MGEALLWGAVAASSLVIGCLLALVWDWPKRMVGLALAFGAGALVSAISFELAAEGIESGGFVPMGAGLAAGAVAYYGLNRFLDWKFGNDDSSGSDESGEEQDAEAADGRAITLGAIFDGIPEQLVLGIGFAASGAVSPGLLAAVFVSNLPEAIGATDGLEEAGSKRSRILLMWVTVAIACALATVVGYFVGDAASGELLAVANGFAAGGLIVMLVDSMIPAATREAGNVAGLVTTFGFAVATAISSIS